MVWSWGVPVRLCKPPYQTNWCENTTFLHLHIRPIAAKKASKDNFLHFFVFFVIREYIFGDFSHQKLVFMHKPTSDIFGLKWPQDLRVPLMRGGIFGPNHWRRAACARCHGRLGLIGDQNHIGTPECDKNWSCLYGPPTVPVNAKLYSEIFNYPG